MCPWDYNNAKTNVDGVIRLDYAPFWLAAGLIFEKINGYKEGSFYTKSFVTEYICQETIENTVIEKLNKEFMWHCKTIDDVKL